jgi:hypothetical protein
VNWSYFDSKTGLFLSKKCSTPPDERPAARDGFELIEGDFDHLSQRFDLTTREIVDYQPPQPSPDHEWNEKARRWQLSPKAAQAEADDAIARAAIARLEQQQLRSMREAILGDEQAKARIADIDRQIVGLRPKLKG